VPVLADRTESEKRGLDPSGQQTIDLLSLECLVQISEQGKRGGEVVVFWSKSTNYSRAEQFIQVDQNEGGGTKFFDPGHGLLDSGSEGSERLLRGLPNAEEFVIGHKTSCRLLLNIKSLKGGPSPGAA